MTTRAKLELLFLAGAVLLYFQYGRVTGNYKPLWYLFPVPVTGVLIYVWSLLEPDFWTSNAALLVAIPALAAMGAYGVFAGIRIRRETVGRK